MSTVPLCRNVAALVAVWSVLCAQACYAYQRPAGGTGVGSGALVRVQSAAPFAVRPASFADTAFVAADCRATRVEGFATTASTDAVTFQSLTQLVSANPDGRPCRWAAETPVIVSTDRADVTVNRISGQRTTVFLIVLTVTFVAYVAYGLSQMTFGSSGGRCSRICF
jgi:hypothetical protein